MRSLGPRCLSKNLTSPDILDSMSKFSRVVRFAVASALVPWLTVQPSFAWGADGHKMVNRLAATYLPKDVPAFLRNGNALDTMAYLGPEPDRWRNHAEPELGDMQAPEHFIDLKEAELIGTLPRKRYDFSARSPRRSRRILIFN